MESRSAFRIAADESSKGRTGLVTVVCPKCHKVLRTHNVQVNGFNEWSFSYDYEYDPGTKRSSFVYRRIDLDGHGCCF